MVKKIVETRSMKNSNQLMVDEYVYTDSDMELINKYNLECKLIELCKIGDILTIKNTIEDNPNVRINLSVYNKIFILACELRNLDFAKWLLQKEHKIHIEQAEYIRVLGIACKYENLEFALWLHKFNYPNVEDRKICWEIKFDKLNNYTDQKEK